MDDFRAVVAGNLIRLRLAAGLTQAELGEKLNYSDKSVSKWERGEAVPGHFRDEKDCGPVRRQRGLPPRAPQRRAGARAPISEAMGYSTTVITAVAILGIWTLALLIFIIFWIAGYLLWYLFLYAVPVSLITLLVLHSVFRSGRFNQYIIAGLVLSLLLTVYLTLLPQLDTNPWQIFLLAIPAELVVFLSFRIKKRAKKPHSPVEREQEPEE